MDQFVFICGAPRSGTTLFSNLLDGHKDVFVFPSEVKILTYWLRGQNNKYNLERFFLRDYFMTSDLCFFIHDAARKQFEHYMKIQYGSEGYLKFPKLDEEEFIRNYQNYLKEHGLTIENVYNAIYAAIAPNDKTKRVYIDKRPMDNDIGATWLAKEIPNAKFIHILRDPRTRYNSSKMGHIDKLFGIPFLRQRFSLDRDLATFHSSESMLSLELAKVNKITLGDRYLLLKYEDLVADTETHMRKIADFIGIEFSDSLLKQTMFGQEQPPASSQEKAMRSGVDNSHQRRLKSFYKNTSYLERKILYYYTWDIAQHFGYDIPRTDFIPRREMLRGIKYEPLHRYLQMRPRMFEYLRGSSVHMKQFLYHKMLNEFFNGELMNNLF